MSKTVEQTMKMKHEHHIMTHEATYGAKLGELRFGPTEEQMEQDFEDRRATGELFSQQLSE